MIDIPREHGPYGGMSEEPKQQINQDHPAIAEAERPAVGDGQVKLGSLFIIIGIIVNIISWIMPTTVNTPMNFDMDLGRAIPASSVVNIGLLQNQALVFQGGLALIVIGVILLAAGYIILAIHASREPDVDPAPRV